MAGGLARICQPGIFAGAPGSLQCPGRDAKRDVVLVGGLLGFDTRNGLPHWRVGRNVSPRPGSPARRKGLFDMCRAVCVLHGKFIVVCR